MEESFDFRKITMQFFHRLEKLTRPVLDLKLSTICKLSMRQRYRTTLINIDEDR